MTETKRKVKVAVPVIGTRAEMETVFGELAEETFATERLVAELERKITAVRETYQERLEAQAARLSLLEKMLTVWAKTNRETEFGGQQSIETQFGTLKFFKGQPAAEPKSKMTWPKVLDQIKRCGLAARFIRLTEEPNKEALIDARDDVVTTDQGQFTVGDLGVRVHQQETFTIVVKREPEPATAAAGVTAENAESAEKTKARAA